MQFSVKSFIVIIDTVDIKQKATSMIFEITKIWIYLGMGIATQT